MDHAGLPLKTVLEQLDLLGERGRAGAPQGARAPARRPMRRTRRPTPRWSGPSTATRAPRQPRPNANRGDNVTGGSPYQDALPPFVGDALDAADTGGDLCIQACADDPQVAVHAIRNLSRIAFGRARLRWSQLGFGRTSRTSAEQQTPRNLFGFKDGTANILADDADALAAHVWVGEKDQPSWMAGGSYLVARKIAMLVETWDRLRLAEQDRTIGREKGSGAPLSGGGEFTEPSFHGGRIDTNAHVRLAHPAVNDGIRILRRGYNYVDGNSDLGKLDAGLFFLSYQRSPEQFIALQKRLSTDLMSEYIRHIGSGIWAIPPGAEQGSYVGAGLFA